MIVLKFLLLAMVSLSAFADEACHLSFMEARALTFKLESSKKLRTNPANEFTCSSYRTSRNYVQNGGKNRFIEGFCGGKYQRLDIGSLHFSDDGKGYERLDEDYLCRTDYRRPKEKLTKELMKLKMEPSCSLRDSFGSNCYYPREKPVLKAALIYYGTFWNAEDIARFKDIYIERFNTATQGTLSIEVVKTKAIPFRHPLPKSFAYNNITDLERLHRIFYWAEIGKDLREELYWEYFYSEDDKEDLRGIDVLLTVTGAQEEGNGYAGAQVVVVEQPREVAWGGLKDNGSTEILSDNQLADILVHETGHFIGLGHAVEKCDPEKMTNKEVDACCARSENKDDVMSYCRDRKSEDVNLFRSCSQKYIKSHVVPRILAGGKRTIDVKYECD